VSCCVQTPLGGPDQTTSETQVAETSIRWVRAGFRQVRGLCLVRSGPVRVRVVEFGTGPTRLCRWSDLVVSFLHGPDRTRHVRACDQVSDKVWSMSNFTTRTHGPTDLVCDPTRPDPSVRVEIERKSLQPDKVRGLVGDPSGPWVWSGRVRVVTVVEFRNYTTRPDQRQSLVGAVWWNLDIRQHRMLGVRMRPMQLTLRGLLVCWLQQCALQRRMNRSRRRLGWT